MITVDIDRIQTTDRSPRVEAVVAADATAGVASPLDRGDASAPAKRRLGSGADGASSPPPAMPTQEMEWTKDQERRFSQLAGEEAVGTLTGSGRKELERLLALRRRSKNPRRGEELVMEYEQRRLTTDLIKALERYVKFHQGARFKIKTDG